MEIGGRLLKLLGALLLMGGAACGPQSGKIGEQAIPARVPLALLVEATITGEVLGSRLETPSGLAVAPSGHVFVTDAGANRLVRLSADLEGEADIGGYGFAAGLFNHPTFLVIDNALNLLVCDEGNRRVTRYNSRLSYTDEIAFSDDEDPLKYGYPSGVAVTDYGEVWVADRDRDRVAVFDNLGRFDRFVGDFAYAGGQLASPEKILGDGHGNFIVCDAGNARLVVYDDYGGYSHEFHDRAFQYPVAAAVERDHLWVLDGAAGLVICFDRQGKKLFVAGPTLTGNSQPLKEPSDIAVLPDGRLLVADSGNSRLLVCRVMYSDP